MICKEKFESTKSNLWNFFLVASFALEEAKNVKPRNTSKDEVYYRLIRGPKIKICESFKELRSKMGLASKRSFNGLVLIRLVSILENYFNDFIREIFSRNTIIFAKNTTEDTPKIGFTRKELLGFELIEDFHSILLKKEVSHFDRMNFSDKTDYFKKMFSIDFRKISNSRTIERLFDDRNIIVHRLGKPTSEYRKKYKFTQKRLPLWDIDVYRYFNHVDNLVEFINKKARTIPYAPKGIKKSDEPLVKYFLKVQTKKGGLRFVSGDFRYPSGENIFSLSRILLKYKKIKNIHELHVKGERRAVMPYIHSLQVAEKANLLEIINVTK